MYVCLIMMVMMYNVFVFVVMMMMANYDVCFLMLVMMGDACFGVRVFLF